MAVVTLCLRAKLGGGALAKEAYEEMMGADVALVRGFR